MARKVDTGHLIGHVEGTLGRQYSVSVTPRQKVVVVAGNGYEWRWPLADYQNLDPAHAPLFHNVDILLHDKGYIS